MINEELKTALKEKIERARREKALYESIESGLINEGVWDSLKNMIGGKDPEHSTKVSGTLKRSMDQAANKTVKNMFDQFEKDYPGFPNIKDSDKFEKGVTSLGLMYQSVKESALNGQMPVEVANSIVVTLKQYTEALLQDLSRTYKFMKEEEELEELEEVSAGKAALGGAAAGAAAMVPGVASAVGGAATSAAAGYGGLLAGAAQGVGGLATWVAGGTAMTAGGLLATLAMVGAPLVIGAGALMIGKRLFGSSRQGMLKKLVKMLDPVDPAQAAPYSGERASQASSVAQSVGQGDFKAATQGYTGMQNTYAQAGVQQLQQQPQVVQQLGGALEDAIGAENAAAFVAVAAGKQKLEDLPELQQDIVRAVLGQFQTGDPEENIESAIEVAENEAELEQEKEKLGDETEAEPDATGGGEALPQETPLSITNSNAEQEEPLVAVIQDLGLPQDAAALIATKMVDYLNSREIPVSEGNLKRLASKIAVSLKEQMKVTDTRTSTRMKRPPVPDEEDPVAPPAAVPPGGDSSDPNQVAQQAMAQRAQGQAAPAPTDPSASAQQKSPEEIAALKDKLKAQQAQRAAAAGEPEASNLKDRSADTARAKMDAGDSAIGKILVRAFEQAPEGDPLKTPEAVAVFSDPEKLKSLFDQIGLALKIQLQKRQYAPNQIDALLEHLLRQALLTEQDDKRLGRWKELANI
jgi:hypothetical protein